MILCDVNVLVYAFRSDVPHHDAWSDWLEAVVDSDHAFGLSDVVAQGFVRVVTHHRVFKPPSTPDRALAFVEAVRARPNSVRVEPGERHWSIFARLVRTTGARGNDVPDAWLAALAIEHGCEWITADRGFGRFEGLRWSCPVGGGGAAP